MVGSAIKSIGDANPLCGLTSRELANSYASRSLSPVEVTRAALDRAEAIQPLYNAFTRIDHVAALAQARASEARWGRGEPLSPVDGVPVTIKDIIWVENWPARYGSLTTADTPCSIDAPAVARLRAAGVTLLGLTATPEFGWKAVTDGPFSGITRNPWNPALTPGGSSGGAAVAALCRAGVFHLGTDGGGSIRIPCAFTGLAGLKPSYGRVPAYPASAFGTVAHLGPMARRVADIRAMLGAMAGRDAADWQQGPAVLPPLAEGLRRFAGARIGFWSEPPCSAVDSEIAATVAAIIDDLARLGATVTPIILPGHDLLGQFNAHWYVGAATRAASLTPEQRSKLDPGLQDVVAMGERYGAVALSKAMAERAAFGRAMDALAERFDIIVSPATAVLPFPVGLEVPPDSGLARWVEWAGFSFPINLSQQPAAVVPCGRSEEGLPIGLQIIAGRGEDSRVLDFAQAFEDAFPEHFS